MWICTYVVQQLSLVKCFSCQRLISRFRLGWHGLHVDTRCFDQSPPLSELRQWDASYLAFEVRPFAGAPSCIKLKLGLDSFLSQHSAAYREICSSAWLSSMARLPVKLLKWRLILSYIGFRGMSDSMHTCQSVCECDKMYSSRLPYC